MIKSFRVRMNYFVLMNPSGIKKKKENDSSQQIISFRLIHSFTYAILFISIISEILVDLKKTFRLFFLDFMDKSFLIKIKRKKKQNLYCKSFIN